MTSVQYFHVHVSGKGGNTPHNFTDTILFILLFCLFHMYGLKSKNNYKIKVQIKNTNVSKDKNLFLYHLIYLINLISNISLYFQSIFLLRTVFFSFFIYLLLSHLCCPPTVKFILSNHNLSYI